MKNTVHSIIYPSGLVLTNTQTEFDGVGVAIENGEIVARGPHVYAGWIEAVQQWHKTKTIDSESRLVVSEIEKMMLDA